MRSRPGGAWPSPVTFESLVEGAVHPADLKVDAGRIFWLESRPAERGRMAAMMWDGSTPVELTSEPFNVRTRVHEYGGAAYAIRGDVLWFSNFRDQRLHALGPDGAPAPLTEPGYRYAELQPLSDGGLIAVREDHTDPSDVRNAIVALSGQAGDSGRVLWGESDFVAYPRLSGDGRRLAWVAWDHPDMPWDRTRLYVANLDEEGLSGVELVAGGGEESVVEPQWGPDGALHFISDRSGFWNLYRRGPRGQAHPVLPMDAEFANPLWVLGQANYALMDDGRIVARYASGGRDHLVVIDPDGGAARELPAPFVECGGLHRLNANTIALIGAFAEQSPAVMSIEIDTGAVRVIWRPSPAAIDPAFVSRAQPIRFPSAGGRTAYALYYPPKNGQAQLKDGEAPPLIVQAHGGPTARASAAFSLSNQFWTSRGFALVDVDYGGSAGYGRAYRQALQGQWGVVDVEDVIAAAKHLVEAGLADAERIAIHGGSAGGFTVLAALAQSDVFSAGADFYGVADLEALARDTHKFESRYLDGLVGPYPQAQAVYQARSPINQLDSFRAPLIIFQGAEDPIVPPNQARMILEALRARSVPVAYLEYQGESHGFRRAETIISSKQAELFFYGRIFGVEPADELPETPIENLA
jgi:dipeptidyl aminopeptidase/acylaminoacyl peptidase